MTSDRRCAVVTGASGFAGRHLCELLVRRGWDVVGIVHSRTADLPGVREHRVDLDDDAELSAIVGACRPEVVYHLAAIVDTVTTPDVMRLYRTNVLGTAAILEAAKSSPEMRRVLIASSSFAYGRTSTGSEPVPETTPLRPFTPYGISKAAAEDIAWGWSRETGFEVVVTRAFQHTGPGHVGRYALADWASQLAAGKKALSVGNLDVDRDYLDVRDVASAYYEVMQNGRSGRVYNVASGVPRSMGSLLRGLIEAFESDAEIRVDPARVRPSDQPTFYGAIDRITGETGWRPSFSIDETLRDLAAWYLDRRLTEADV